MYYRPPEWHPKKGICLAWPYDKNLWEADLLPAQKEFCKFLDQLDHEKVFLFVPKNFSNNLPPEIKEKPYVEIIEDDYADIWFRDTLFIQVKDKFGNDFALIPKFNGWGGKYFFERDKTLAIRAAKKFSLAKVQCPFIFEGGAIETNGDGLLLTTEQCLLNDNRKSQNKSEIESEFKNYLGAKNIIWLKRGLKNDHTDGHIDTIARFIAKDTVVVMSSDDRSDQNFEIYQEIIETLQNANEKYNLQLNIIRLPSPGNIFDREKNIMPASYLNFLITDKKILMPTYDSIFDEEARKQLQKYFEQVVVGLSARAILSGGGAFHCISQEIF